MLGSDYDDASKQASKQAPRRAGEGEQGEAEAIKRKSDLISLMRGFSTRENRRMDVLTAND
jgi:hypothetical protein